MNVNIFLTGSRKLMTLAQRNHLRVFFERIRKPCYAGTIQREANSSASSWKECQSKMEPPIRWRGIWLPWESHSYSRRLPALHWISSLWHSEHWAESTSHQHRLRDALFYFILFFFPFSLECFFFFLILFYF